LPPSGAGAGSNPPEADEVENGNPVILTGDPYPETGPVQLDSEWLKEEDTLDGIFSDNICQGYGTYFTNITDNLHLPTIGQNGSTITWTSNKPDVIESNGAVHRPENGDKQ
jgi:hypothetical protein